MTSTVWVRSSCFNTVVVDSSYLNHVWFGPLYVASEGHYCHQSTTELRIQWAKQFDPVVDLLPFFLSTFKHYFIIYFVNANTPSRQWIRIHRYTVLVVVKCSALWKKSTTCSAARPYSAACLSSPSFDTDYMLLPKLRYQLSTGSCFPHKSFEHSLLQCS